MRKPVKIYLDDFFPLCVQRTPRINGAFARYADPARRKFFWRRKSAGSGAHLNFTRPHNSGRQRGLNGAMRHWCLHPSGR